MKPKQFTHQQLVNIDQKVAQSVRVKGHMLALLHYKTTYDVHGHLAAVRHDKGLDGRNEVGRALKLLPLCSFDGHGQFACDYMVVACRNLPNFSNAVKLGACSWDNLKRAAN